MRNIISLFMGAMLFASAQSSTAQAETSRPGVLVIGASHASNRWPVVLDSSGAEASVSKNPLIRGLYQGLCDKLAVALDGEMNVVCKAVAGAMGSDFVFPSVLTPDPSLQISVPGYASQFAQGLRECTWNGQMLCKYLVISIANDGPYSIAPAQQVIDQARGLGMKVIVQSYMQWGTFSFAHERDVAIANHGSFWGGVIQAFLQVLPTEADYNALAGLHRQALQDYPGVNAYVDFYPKGSIDKTLDGVHPEEKLQESAAKIVKKIITGH